MTYETLNEVKQLLKRLNVKVLEIVENKTYGIIYKTATKDENLYNKFHYHFFNHTYVWQERTDKTIEEVLNSVWEKDIYDSLINKNMNKRFMYKPT